MERRGSELIGLPILTFDSGRKLAHVDDLLVDPERNQVLALLIDGGAFFQSARVIPFGHIQAIGQNAVIVPKSGVIYEVKRLAELQRVLDGRTIKGMRVYSERGDRLGIVGDMIIDDHSGEVLYYEVSGGALGDAMKGKRTIVPDEILNMGELVLYVSQATAARLESEQGGVAAAFEQARQRINQASDTAADTTNARLGRLGDQARRQQRAYLIGRTALRDVDGADGRPLVHVGEIISETTVEQAEAQERFGALLLAGGLGGVQNHIDTLGRQANDGLSRLWNWLQGHNTRLTAEADTRLEQARIDRALGRPAGRVVLDRQDTVILDTGDIITNAAVARAREAGVLGLLLDSVVVETPPLGLADLKAHPAVGTKES
jgi:uncharacterized protein YrrD